MGVIPFEFLSGESADTLGLTGKERFTFHNLELVTQEPNVTLKVSTDDDKEFTVKSRVDTGVELSYLKNGGILHTVLRKLADEEQISNL